MAEVNVINWHVNPFRADKWYEAWLPALRRAGAFGATSVSLTRSEDDHLHFVQTTVWESRADFERYWSSDEVSRAREDALDWFNKPLLPSWHVQLVSE
jgi:heme-degrading monooxygenase HmoA